MTPQSFLSDDEWTALNIPDLRNEQIENSIKNLSWYRIIDKMFDRISIDVVISMVEDQIKKMEEALPQSKLNGSENLWIVKPGYQSRGRGIKIFNNIDDIMFHLKRARCN